ncbi:hypothetical protein PM082_021610 [Marasmius tenuissimus]|nr:hypothetical protein PM082_021610 [Marasmius tenuissimus]
MRMPSHHPFNERQQNDEQATTPAASSDSQMSGPRDYPRRVSEKKNRGLRHPRHIRGHPPTVADDRRGRGMGSESQVLAKLDMIIERVSRLESGTDRDRDREEAPPDYTSNRS